MTTPISGQQPDPDEQKILDETAKHWQQIWNDAPAQALTRIEDAAKQMIVVTTGLQGLYVALFVFSSIREQALTLLGNVMGRLLLFLFFIPLACWLLSLWNATRVFIPRVQPDTINLNELSAGTWRKIRDEYGRINTQKLRWLHHSHRWLIISFVFVLLVVTGLVFLPPTPPAGPTQIIIVTPTP
jgi:hypothetical protein